MSLHARACVPLEVLLLLAVAATINVVGAIALIPDRGGDFAMLYDSTRAWLDGLGAYSSTQPTANLNHPLLWLVVTPFTALPVGSGFVEWTLVSIVLLVVAARVTSGIVGLTILEIVIIGLSAHWRRPAVAGRRRDAQDDAVPGPVVTEGHSAGVTRSGGRRGLGRRRVTLNRDVSLGCGSVGVFTSCPTWVGEDR